MTFTTDDLKRVTKQSVTLFVDPGEQLKIWKKYRDSKGKKPTFEKIAKDDDYKVKKGDHYLVTITWKNGCNLQKYADDTVWVKAVMLSLKEKEISEWMKIKIKNQLTK